MYLLDNEARPVDYKYHGKYNPLPEHILFTYGDKRNSHYRLDLARSLQSRSIPDTLG